MIDYTRRGQKVKIKGPIRTMYRTFRGDEYGVVLCEFDSGVDRKLLEVEWFAGGHSPVFPEDVEVVEEQR